MGRKSFRLSLAFDTFCRVQPVKGTCVVGADAAGLGATPAVAVVPVCVVKTKVGVTIIDPVNTACTAIVSPGENAIEWLVSTHVVAGFVMVHVID